MIFIEEDVPVGGRERVTTDAEFVVLAHGRIQINSQQVFGTLGPHTFGRECAADPLEIRFSPRVSSCRIWSLRSTRV